MVYRNLQLGFAIFLLRLNTNKLFLKSKYSENMNYEGLDHFPKFRIDICCFVSLYISRGQQVPDLKSQSTSSTFCLIREDGWSNKEGEDRAETVGQESLR